METSLHDGDASLSRPKSAADVADCHRSCRATLRREIRSFWYPTWLAQAAVLVPGSKLMDAVPHCIELEAIVREARQYDLAVLHI